MSAMLLAVLRVLLLAALASGCVNDYRVRGSDDESTTAAMGDTTTKGGMGDATAGEFGCDPCSADSECGDDWDNCVSLDEIGSHCLFACPEAGCPEGLTCREVLSVDGVSAMQCAPGNASCMPESTSTG